MNNVKLIRIACESLQCRKLYLLQYNRLRRRWVDNIKMDLQKVGWGCMDWINVAQDRNR